MSNTGIGAFGLLDILAAKSGCMYLSDLAGTGGAPLLPHYLEEMDADAFSLREWEDAVAYLPDKVIPLKRRSRRNNI